LNPVNKNSIKHLHTSCSTVLARETEDRIIPSKLLEPYQMATGQFKQLGMNNLGLRFSGQRSNAGCVEIPYGTPAYQIQTTSSD